MKTIIITSIFFWFINYFSVNTFEVQEILAGRNQQVKKKYHIEVDNPKKDHFEIKKIWVNDYYLSLEKIDKKYTNNPIVINIEEIISRDIQKSEAPISTTSKAVIVYSKGSSQKEKYLEVEKIKVVEPKTSR